METHPVPRIIYEDDSILVIEKPVGLVVHGDGRTEERTLVDWVLEHYSNMQDVGEPWVNDQGVTIHRPGIVHRLDRETSGVMVLAKTQEAFDNLKAQFQEHSIKKEYIAVVHGTFKEDQLKGVIERKIGKSPKDFRRWSAQPGARGLLREAVTEYEVLQQRGAGNDGYALVRVRPKTGRTHQIRVHMKAIHHPIVGDTLYGHEDGANRMMLHATALYLMHPCSGAHMSWQSPAPTQFDLQN